MLQGWSSVLRAMKNFLHLPAFFKIGLQRPYYGKSEGQFLDMGRTWHHHHESLLLHRLDTYSQGGIHYVKWGCKLVLSAKTDLTGAPLNLTHPCFSSLNMTAGPTVTLEHSPMGFDGTCTDCTKKERNFCSTFLMAMKNKIKFRTFQKIWDSY